MENERANPPEQTRLVLFLIFTALAVPTYITLPDPGLTWDESIYAGFAVRYWEWLMHPSLSSHVLTKVWWIGQAHPPLAKLILGLSIGMFGRVFAFLHALRFPCPLWYAGTGVLIYLYARRHLSTVAAVCSVIAFATMPRVFGHAHLAALDMPVTFFWLAAVYVFLVALENGPGSSMEQSESTDSRNENSDKDQSLQTHKLVVAGVVLGLALLTKINAVFLIPCLAMYVLLFHRRNAIEILVWVFGVAFVLFLVGWPGLYPAPVERVFSYFADKLHRQPIEVYFLGKTYGAHPAPAYYPLVMIVATLPVGTLVTSVIGLGHAISDSLHKPAHRANTMILLSLLGTVGPFLLPPVGKYDGVRLFLPAFPFLALTCGLTADRFVRIASKYQKHDWLYAGLVAFFIVQGVGILITHPYELAYYGGAVGGLRGARRIGMETTYWGDTLDEQAIAAVNKICKNKRVAFFPVGSFVPDYLQKVIGYLDKDVKIVDYGEGSRRDWDYCVLIPRQGKFDELAWQLYKKAKPIWRSKRCGVRMCMIYRAPKKWEATPQR